MDHIHPVVDPAVGWVSLDMFADRLLCDESGFQAICLECHDVKTKGENQIRKQTRAEANLKKKLHTREVRKRNPKVNKHTGGSLDEFLKECGISLEDKELDKSK
jgi:cytochrome c553